MTSGPGPLSWLDDRARARVDAGLRRTLRPRPATTGLLDLASNDYLGLARDPRVVEAAARAVREWGAGSTGSRLVTGTTTAHAALEEELAAHVGCEAALVFSSGYLANLGAVTALSGPGALVASDAHNHASVVDACRLSRAEVAVVPHRDPAALEDVLRDRAPQRALAVTDAVFSVDGEAAPLAELVAVAARHGAVTVIDEAHALGVLGEHGRGLAAAVGVQDRGDVVLTVTFSKSLGTQGGAVLGPRAVVDHLVDAARPFIFDTALAPACVGAARAALAVLREEPGLPGRAVEVARTLAGLAAEAGLTVSDPDAAVVSVVLGSPQAAVRAQQVCREHGVDVGCFRPPSVPDGLSRLRLTARADLTDADLGLVARALAAVAADAGAGR